MEINGNKWGQLNGDRSIFPSPATQTLRGIGGKIDLSPFNCPHLFSL
jgi:hypothetical protein